MTADRIAAASSLWVPGGSFGAGGRSGGGGGIGAKEVGTEEEEGGGAGNAIEVGTDEEGGGGGGSEEVGSGEEMSGTVVREGKACSSSRHRKLCNQSRLNWDDTKR